MREMRTKQEYLLSIPFEYIIGFSRETGLIRRNGYFTKKDFVHHLLRTLKLSECKQLFGYHQNGLPYKKAVEQFLNRYPTSELISKSFVDYLDSTIENLGTLYFEFPILKTRVDILRLYDHSYAYEVKSQRDRIDRLHYQLPALKKVFEYTYLIIPSESKHRIIKIIDKDVGIITFASERSQMIFEVDREPEMVNALDKYAQLDLLRMDELMDLYNNTYGTKPKKSKKEIIEVLIENFECYQMNEVFKSTIRNRKKVRTRSSVSINID